MLNLEKRSPVSNAQQRAGLLVIPGATIGGAGIEVANLIENNHMTWNIYLSGEIHTDWRQQIIDGCAKLSLDVIFSSAVTDHPASDAAGDVLGSEESGYWRDHKSAKVNKIRIQNAIANCDLAIVRFGDKYKQWNAAFDAGYCAALGRPYITLHDESIIHPLKEVDASAEAWAQTTQQVVEIIHYLLAQK